MRARRTFRTIRVIQRVPVVAGVSGQGIGAVVLGKARRAVEVARVIFVRAVDTRQTVLVIDCIITDEPVFN